MPEATPEVVWGDAAAALAHGLARGQAALNPVRAWLSARVESRAHRSRNGAVPEATPEVFWGDATVELSRALAYGRAALNPVRAWLSARVEARVPSLASGAIPRAIPAVAWGDVAGAFSNLLARTRAALVSSRARPWLFVTALAVVGLVVRLLVTRGIWVDEAISIHQAQLPFHEMVNDLQRTDRHPPLYYAVLWVVVHVFGTSELAVRAPSIIAGTLLVPVLFLCGRELYDRRTGLVSAALGAVAPLVVWYSQETRMYAFFMLFAAVALWAQVCAIRRGKTRHWVIYTLATIALLWTHYFAILYVGVQQLALAFAVWRRAHRREPVRGLLIGSLLSSVAIVLAILPLIPFAQHQLAVSEAAGTGFSAVPTQAAPSTVATPNPSVYAFFSNLLWAVWGYHSDTTMLRLAALWPLAMLLALALLGRGRSGKTLLLFSLAFVPMLVLFAIGFVQRDLFEIRYFAGSVPAFLLLAARGATASSSERRIWGLMTGALIASSLLGLADQQLNSKNPRLYDFRGALHQVSHQARDGDVLVYAPGYLRDTIDYYRPPMRVEPLRGRIPRPTASGRVFLLVSFLDSPKVASGTGFAVYHLRRERGLVRRVDDGKIRMWIFGKRKRVRG